MIDFYESGITEILPDHLRGDPEIQAISYAISRQLKRMGIFSMQTSLSSVIDILEEDKLDLLAVELRTQYYGDFLCLGEKRRMIKNTLLWYYRAGTLSTVQELTDFIFRNAVVEEWFSYEASPYLFRVMIEIMDQDISLEMYMRYLQSIKTVKNTRSHLEAIIYRYHTKAKVNSAAVGRVGNYIKIKRQVQECLMVAAILKMDHHLTVKGNGWEAKKR